MSAFIGAFTDIMISGFGWPQAETIMMFRNNYYPVYSARFCRAKYLHRAEMRWVKNLRGLITITPFLVSKDGHTEMNNTIYLRFLPAQLPGRRQNTVWFRRWLCQSDCTA